MVKKLPGDVNQFLAEFNNEEGHMEKTITPEISRSVFRAVPLLVDFPASRFWVDYDHEADVLYISFQRPQKATDTEMTDEGILLRYQDEKLVGITVLDASTRSPDDMIIKSDTPAPDPPK